MVIDLNMIQNDAGNPVDYAVIDELRRASPWLINNLVIEDTVIPDAFGSSLEKGYTRQKSTRTASTRQENTEYPVDNATVEQKSTTLIPLGARYNIDRVYARVGAINQVTFQQGEAVKATVALFNTLAIRGVPRPFSDANPSFEGLDSIVSGTITEFGGDVPFDGRGLFTGTGDQTKQKGLAAKRALDSWIRKFDGLPTVFLANEEGIAWLDGINDALGRADVVNTPFGGQNPTYKGIPYVDLGATAAKVDMENVLTGEAAEESVIQTDSNGVTAIYAVRMGIDGVHAYGLQGGQQIQQWLPDFTRAGAVKPGEVELGPIGLAVKKTRAAGVFRVRVDA